MSFSDAIPIIIHHYFCHGREMPKTC